MTGGVNFGLIGAFLCLLYTIASDHRGDYSTYLNLISTEHCTNDEITPFH